MSSIDSVASCERISLRGKAIARTKKNKIFQDFFLKELFLITILYVFCAFYIFIFLFDFYIFVN